MKEIKYVLKNPLGIHARPAGQMVKIATGCKCDITISTSVRTANAKRIIGIMALGPKQGDEITFTFSGEDEEEAAAAIKEFLVKNL